MDRIINVVIFAAGKGERMEQLGERIPKMLLPVWKNEADLEPLLFRLMRQISFVQKEGYRINKIYIVVNHLREHIIKFVKSMEIYQEFDVEFVTQEPLNGEAGGLFLLPDEPFPLLVMDGDNYLEDDHFFSALLKEYFSDNVIAVIGVREVADIERYANCKVSTRGYLIDIIEKPYKGMEFGSLAKMGCYVLSRALIEKGENYFQDSKGDLATTAAFSNTCRTPEKIRCLEYGKEFLYFDIGIYRKYIAHLLREGS